jgi:hypothetical protein
MTIETKYNIGDKVWFMHQNLAKSAIIVKIDIIVEISMNDTNIYKNIWYSLFNYQSSYAEQTIFPTKEELLKSL